MQNQDKITKEESKKRIKSLLNEFTEFSEKELNSKSENQIKSEFIDPLFEALGWDMRRDAQREPRILKGRADYILKLKNQEVLVIEAKKTSVSLDEEEGQQAVSYAYHRKIKFAVLTNFKEIKIFHALSNIKNIFKNLLKDEKGYLTIYAHNFEEQFDRLWLLSKESFENGEINKLLSAKDEKLSKPIDESILNDLLDIREWLSKDLKSKKNYLEQNIIDETVQLLIDRLIFIRSVEDRGLELTNFLLSLESDVSHQRVKYQLFPYLVEKFKEFDAKYDSKLFEPNLLEKEGAFSDDVLGKVIKVLYFGTGGNNERYLFDEIPGDLLGSIYEQYLGTILRSTEKRVTLDESSGKRKKMGIFYTPHYIVEYIVKNTVYEYIKNKTIDEILEVRIVDPACGSGSFLLRAFKEVCTVVEDKLKKDEFAEKESTFKDYDERLNLSQKMTILVRCIYGVDLDEKAIELARLNLLLGLLDEEGPDTKKRLLPHLENNIKQGNSLIDDRGIAGDNAFNWQAQFKHIFADGGFDVVIGNPPYVDYSKIQGSEYLNGIYESTKVNDCVVKYNLFQLFIEKSIILLKPKGKFGFINPNTYLSADNAFSLRKIILEKTSLKQIIDLSHLNIFKDASTYPVITIFEKGKTKDNMLGVSVINDESEIIPTMKLTKIFQIDFEKDNGLNFVVGGSSESKKIMDKLDLNIKLKELKEIFVWGSSITGFATFKRDTPNNQNAPVIQTRDIKRYTIEWKNEYIEKSIYSNKLINLFKQKKLVIARVTKGIQATIDTQEFFVGKSSILIPKNKNLFEFLLAALNSSLINFYYKSKFETTHMAGGYMRFDIPYLESIPIKLPTSEQEKKITHLVNQMLELQKKYHSDKMAGNEKDRLKQQIDSIDYELDQEVYTLYGINKEEQKIIEETLNKK